jgi:predicted nucleic acid-binding protein
VAVERWLLDKSAASRVGDSQIAEQLSALAGTLVICPVGILEQLHSARSASDYDALESLLLASFEVIDAPHDVMHRAIALQRDLAHHHGMWHRIPIPDLLIAETALHHNLGVVHVDRDYDHIAEVRPLRVRRLRTGA